MYIGQTQQLIFFIIDTDGSSNGGLFVADPNLNISYWQGYNYIASPEREPAEDFGFGLYKLSVMNKYIYLDWRDIRCLLYTSDAADERSSVDLGGRRLIKKKKHITLKKMDDDT